MKKIFGLCIFVFALFSAGNSFAELTVSAKSLSGSSWGPQTFVDDTNFPYLEAKIAVKDNGKLINVEKDNIIIYERSTSGDREYIDGAVPFYIDPVATAGYQTIRWYPQTISTGEDIPTYQSQLVVTVGDESAAFKSFNGYFENAYDLYLYTYGETAGSVVSVNEFRDNWRPIANSGRISRSLILRVSNTEKIITLDSISFEDNESGVFSYEINGVRKGDKGIFETLPCDLTGEYDYVVRIYFQPIAGKYETEIATVVLHYEGGLEKRVPLFFNEDFNEVKYEKETILEILEPNGGEIFTPCQEIEIKWKNHNRTEPVLVQFRKGEGYEWHRADGEMKEGADSIFLWRVPADFTETGQIRISQSTSAKNTHSISPGGLVKSIAYNALGSKAAAATIFGTVKDYNLYPEGGGIPVEKNAWTLTGENFRDNGNSIFGVEYINDDTLMVGFDSLAFGKVTSYMAYLKDGQIKPYKLARIEDAIGCKKMLITSDRKYLILITDDFSPKMKIYDSRTLTEVDGPVFKSPIMDIELNSKLPKALVATMDGMIYEVSVPGFNIENEIDLSNQNIPITIGYSPSGKLISLGYPMYKGGKADNFLYDIEKGQIVTPIRVSGSKPIKHIFSPDSRSLLIGSREYFPALVNLDNLKGYKELDKLHNSGITDLEFAPDAQSIISGSDDSNESAGLFKFGLFSFSDSDEIDDFIKIVPVELATPEQNLDIILGDIYLGTDNEVIISQSTQSEVKNIGNVDIVYENISLAQGVHFELDESIEKNDTLNPGEVGYFKLKYYPRKVGEINDTLRITICGEDYEVPLKGSVKPRNIEFFTDNLHDFGEACLRDTVTYSGAIITNLDPVPLRVLNVSITGENSWSFSNKSIGDTLLEAGKSLFFDLKFIPLELGELNATLKVAHSVKNGNFYDSLQLRGTGIGTEFETSHTHLLFIPEIKTRKLTIKNIAQNHVKIENIDLDTEGYFKVITELPKTLQTGDSLIIEVEQIKDIEDSDKLIEMIIDATPCLTSSQLYLGEYKGSATINIPNIETPATEEFKFNIDYKTTNNVAAYAGNRFYEGELTANPRLMMPFEISSPLGKAEIISNKVENDLRIWKFRVEGDFGREGILAEVKALPGIAETDESEINILGSSIGFGNAVEDRVNKGKLKITGTNGRKIYRPETNLSNLAITPNPADEFVDIHFEAEVAEPCSIEIVNSTGAVISSTTCADTKPGLNSRKIITSSISNGNYTVRVHTLSSQISSTLIIQR